MANGIRIGGPREFNKVRSSVKVPEFDKHLKKVEVHIGRNVVEIRIKMYFFFHIRLFDGVCFQYPQALVSFLFSERSDFFSWFDSSIPSVMCCLSLFKISKAHFFNAKFHPYIFTIYPHNLY